MTSVIQSVEALNDYTLRISMRSGNRLAVCMAPHLHTVQFCPLLDRQVWTQVQAKGTSLYWEGAARVELSLDRLLYEFLSGPRPGTRACVQEASADAEHRLCLRLDNGNSMELSMRELLQAPPFTPLADERLWCSLRVRPASLVWEKRGVSLDIAVENLLRYFA